MGTDGRRYRIGIMGGTFDPIHVGHLILGESAFEQFGLDEVLFMPSGNPPHKINREGASNEERVDMVSLAIEDNPHFTLSLEEMHELGYIYTSKTLERLTERNPDTDYYFIMGADSLFSFDQWHEPQRICELCILVVAVRDHASIDELEQKMNEVRQRYHAEIKLLHTPNIDISSHQIRQWIREGKGCRYYLHDSTRDYIAARKLYH